MDSISPCGVHLVLGVVHVVLGVVHVVFGVVHVVSGVVHVVPGVGHVVLLLGVGHVVPRDVVVQVSSLEVHSGESCGFHFLGPRRDHFPPSWFIVGRRLFWVAKLQI